MSIEHPQPFELLRFFSFPATVEWEGRYYHDPHILQSGDVEVYDRMGHHIVQARFLTVEGRPLLDVAQEAYDAKTVEERDRELLVSTVGLDTRESTVRSLRETVERQARLIDYLEERDLAKDQELAQLRMLAVRAETRHSVVETISSALLEAS
jgi:hypothetical protein